MGEFIFQKIRFYPVLVRFNPWQMLFLVIKELNSTQNGRNIPRNGQEEGHTETLNSQRMAKLLVF
jgi:hypothetical protein